MAILYFTRSIFVENWQFYLISGIVLLLYMLISQNWMFWWSHVYTFFMEADFVKFQNIVFVDTLVSLIVVAIECLDFSTPSLFDMATTASGKSPNTTPTKWNKRFQRPMGNMTSMVSVVAKLLSACERTRNSMVIMWNIVLIALLLTIIWWGFCNIQDNQGQGRGCQPKLKAEALIFVTEKTNLIVVLL